MKSRFFLTSGGRTRTLELALAWEVILAFCAVLARFFAYWSFADWGLPLLVDHVRYVLRRSVGHGLDESHSSPVPRLEELHRVRQGPQKGQKRPMALTNVVDLCTDQVTVLTT